MSRPIKMTQAYMDECRQDFEKALQLTKLADGKLTFTKTFSIADRQAVERMRVKTSISFLILWSIRRLLAVPRWKWIRRSMPSG